MKIQDLIKLKKLNKEQIDSRWTNEIQKKFFKKHGYSWQVPSHSQDESVLLNNYEKDCVVAYVKNKYLILMLIKLRGDNFRGFVVFNDFLTKYTGSISYKISSIYDKKDILYGSEEDKENFHVVDEELLSKFKKSIILDKLDG